jgi:hypothetical protein
MRLKLAKEKLFILRYILQWNREKFTVPKIIDVPVISIIIVPKPKPRRYSELDSHYQSLLYN